MKRTKLIANLCIFFTVSLLLGVQMYKHSHKVQKYSKKALKQVCSITHSKSI